jgi:hypothetical protein
MLNLEFVRAKVGFGYGIERKYLQQVIKLPQQQKYCRSPE